jgi:hypothetical protein
MSNKRGKRGSTKSKAKFAVQLKIRNEEQLQRTLDLRGVKEDKPRINDVILKIAERLDEEERQEMLAMARRWQRGGDWSKSMIYDCMGEDYPGWDDEEGYDPYEEIFDGICHKGSRKLKELNKKLFKRLNKGNKRGGKKKNHGSEDDDFWKNRHTMFRNGEWSDDDNEDNYEDPYKCIKFYSDIENEMSVREFYSLKDFNDFCGENGYILSTTDYNNLLNWSVVHCCLDPISEEYGEHEIITDNSYGGLYWTVSEDLTKEDAMSHEPVYDGTEARTLTD